MRVPRLWLAVTAALALVIGAADPGVAAAPDTGPTRYLGMFRDNEPGAVAAETKSLYGVTPASVMWFDSFGSGKKFPVADAKKMWRRGVMPHYTWEPWYTGLALDDPDQIKLADIVDGTWDRYIKARAREFARVGDPIMVRWGHEFNGNWYPWGVANNGADPSLYVRAYRHVHDLVEATGATNVRWVWAFNNGSSPGEPWNEPANAYPGDAYVDWVGIDGYNWGFGPSWDPAVDHWSTFDQVVSGAYDKARAIAPAKPIMVSEFASTEDGGDKARWIADMAARLRAGAYPELKLITYFDVLKEEPWAATSSPAAQAAFTDWVQHRPMKGKGRDLAALTG